MEKIVKIKKSLILLICVIIVFIIIILFPILNDKSIKAYKAGYTSRYFDKYPCLIKGEVCSADDIKKSIKVRLAVNENQIYDFYLLSNDEETSTFIMDRNIKNSTNWNKSGDNRVGPKNALIELSEATKDWENIPLISSYEYIDEGLAYYNRKCIENTDSEKKDKNYECGDIETETRGYNSVKIEDGIATIYYNLKDGPGLNYEKEVTLKDYPLRARMIELKELTNLLMDSGEHPDWLIDNLTVREAYWTMTSSTLPTHNYTNASFAVINFQDKVQVEDIPLNNQDNAIYKTTGIRPVITLGKPETSAIVLDDGK